MTQPVQSVDDQPFVSVLIPVFNDAERLKLCLGALERQTYPQDAYEVLVIDNGSTEDIGRAAAGFAHAVLLTEAQPGSYHARNTGLAHAKGDLLAFTDSDCIPQDDWLERGVTWLQRRPDCGLVAGQITLFFQNPARPTAVELYESVTAFPQQKFVEKYRFGATANVFTFRRTFERAGQFDASLKSGGDREWGQRVAASGLALVYAPDVCVAHPARASFDELHRKLVRVHHGLYNLSLNSPRRYRRLAKALVKDVIPPVGAMRQIWADRRLRGANQRLQAIGVLLSMRYLQAWTRVRMQVAPPRNTR